jgi:hypothetical protein
VTNPDENTDENTDDERFTLSDTVFVGRRADAYEALFDLDLAELDADSLLDCPGGPCSFTAHANERGLDATAADALYGRPPAEIRDRAEAGVDTLRATFAGDGDASRFCWSFYDSVDAMLRRSTTTRSIWWSRDTCCSSTVRRSPTGSTNGACWSCVV